MVNEGKYDGGSMVSEAVILEVAVVVVAAVLLLTLHTLHAHACIMS